MLIVVMGVSGSGKSTLARTLADTLGWDYLEGDDLHAPASIERMRAGMALDDDDRWPWLERIANWIRRQSEQGRSGVVACSALKRSYRDCLRGGGEVRFVYLRVAREELECRLGQRLHFMPASLLDSQLGILQEPGADEAALTLPGSGTTQEQLQLVLRWIDRQA